MTTMRGQDGKPVRFGAGMNMLAPDYAMPDGAVRDATNLDVTTEGVLRTRQGYASSPLVPGASCHSLYATAGMMLFADGNSLKRMTGGAASIVATVQPAMPVCHTELPDGSAAWSDGSSIGKVGTSGSSVPLSMPAPGSPAMTAVPNGLLVAGRYTVAATWVALSGEESPPSLPVAIDLADGQGIALSGIPATPPAGAVGLRIYCSHTNEATLFDAALLTAGVTTARIDDKPGGRPLETLFEANFPACTSLAFIAGRLLGARGNMLVWSEPFRFGVYRPARNFIQFTRPVSMIAPTQDGVYVGTLASDGSGECVFLAGFDFGNQPYRPVTPYGAYPGTLVDMPHTLQMMWASPQGFVVADNGGQVTNISMDKVAFPGASRGGSLLREQNGMRQIITSLVPSGADNQFAITDYTDGEIIKGASNE